MACDWACWCRYRAGTVLFNGHAAASAPASSCYTSWAGLAFVFSGHQQLGSRGGGKAGAQQAWALGTRRAPLEGMPVMLNSPTLCAVVWGSPLLCAFRPVCASCLGCLVPGSPANPRVCTSRMRLATPLSRVRTQGFGPLPRHRPQPQGLHAVDPQFISLFISCALLRLPTTAAYDFVSSCICVLAPGSCGHGWAWEWAQWLWLRTPHRA